jgi:hypothetical protein
LNVSILATVDCSSAPRRIGSPAAREAYLAQFSLGIELLQCVKWYTYTVMLPDCLSL